MMQAPLALALALLALCLLGFLLFSGFGTFRHPAYREVNEELGQCQRDVESWADEQMLGSDEKAEEDASEKLQLKDLLFFLHVPRTGGRTYHQCFLGQMYTLDQLCPRSYDKLRFDLSFPGCRLLTTHDDHNILTRLPEQNTSVVTILRHPFNRVVSAYEFSIEVAARFFKVNSRATQIRQQTGNFRSMSTIPPPVSTLDIWPWKLLVPWMREDLFRRRSERTAGLTAISNEEQNPYNISSVAMPLHDFIQHHQTFELVHNGATFQVAGLSNHSFHRKAQKIRLCVVKYPELGTHILRVAKMHLNKMLYVGLTEKHEESAKAFATIVGGQVSQRMLSNHSIGFFSNRSQGQISEDSEPSTASPSPLVNSLKQRQDFVQKLLDAYHSCLKSLQASQASRTTVSLKHIAPVNFSSQDRRNIPSSVVTEILRLNSLDVELYRHAEILFTKQQNLSSELSSFLAKQNQTGKSYTIFWQQLHSGKGNKGIVVMESIGMIFTGLLMFGYMYFLVRGSWRIYFQKLCRSKRKRDSGAD